MKEYLKKVLQVAILLFLALNLYAQKSKTTFSFESTVQYGSQSNNLTVLASTDFNGDYSLASINSATWIDISKDVVLATDKLPAESGNVNISKLLIAGKPLYIAFKYTGKASTKPSQRGWGVQKLSVKNKDLSKNFGPEDFKIVNSSENHEGAGWAVSKIGITFRSNQSTKASESWAIAKVLDADN